MASLLLAGSLPTALLLDARSWAAPLDGFAAGVNPAAQKAPDVPEIGPLQLKVRRLSDAIELVIEGAGMAPQLQQVSTPNGWQGQLSTAAPSGLKIGPQRLSLPELGFQTISFEGSGSSYRIAVVPVAGAPLARPVVSGDGENLIISFPAAAQISLPINRFNARQPGYIPQPSYAPPLQPRAVAPPLGDMAVGTMTLRNPGYLNLSGPPVTMTLKNAPAKDALMALAQIGGYGFAYVAESPIGGPAGSSPADSGSMPISLSFRGESFGRAFNTALLAAGLQGKREGNMILAGPKALSKTFGPQLSKVYRLNQVSANAAADYLANLGATVTKTNTITTSVTQGVAQGEAVSSAANSQTTESSTITNVEAYGASSGPLLGLRATTDSRLSTITLVGDPSIVSIAEQYIKQLDLRQRQVALNVRILDVSLDNASEIDNSFAIRWGSNFIVNDDGQLLGAFGKDLPPDGSAFRRDVPRDIEFKDNAFTVEGGTGGLGLNANSTSSSDFLTITSNKNRQLSTNLLKTIEDSTGSKLVPFSPGEGLPPVYILEPTGSDLSATQKTITRLLGDLGTVSRQRSSGGAAAGVDVTGIARNPGNKYQANTFFDFVRAQIVSGSTKLLASPTLILQENDSELRASADSQSSEGGGLDQYSIDSPIGRRRANEAVVRVGTNVPTQVEVVQNSQTGTTSCNISELTTAGLVLGARIQKIDDNGFVTFVLSPSVSAVTDQEPAGSNCPQINILSVRRLDTGALRVRDGQTLILTGVISDFDRSEVRKWPILGDIPLIGQFFRSTGGRKEKRELVIMVTPRIINDEQGGVYGYGYQPGTNAGRQFMGSSGYPQAPN